MVLCILKQMALEMPYSKRGVNEITLFNFSYMNKAVSLPYGLPSPFLFKFTNRLLTKNTFTADLHHLRKLKSGI